jgi:hypothetical protein
MIPTADPVELLRRNHLLSYARKRVDETVLKPLLSGEITDPIGAEETLEKLHNHFRTHGIAIGRLRVEAGVVMVDIRPMT